MSFCESQFNDELATTNCTSSSSILNIVIDDDESSVTYMDSNSNSQTSDMPYRHRKSFKTKTQKSHRLIEKRRRDRMNNSLEYLLQLVPHQKPDNERRIEKAEIIEMAIKYIKNLGSTIKKNAEPINLNKKTNLKIDAYRIGYHNALYDMFEYITDHFEQEKFARKLVDFCKQREGQLSELTIVPERKDDILISKSIVETERPSQFPNLDDDQTNQQTKVPIFVLHPSGTHYIPMCVDLSAVSHGFNRSSTIHDQTPCHPISIPVNFNSTSSLSDSYDLDIQNINVIGTRHQTSVRPN